MAELPEPTVSPRFILDAGVYMDRLVETMARHVGDLNVLLDAARKGTFNEIALSPTQGQVIKSSYPTVDHSFGATERSVERCFKSLIGSFIDFLDQMITLKRVKSDGITVDREVHGGDAVVEYIEEYIASVRLQVASDRSLQNMSKVNEFPALSTWAKECLEGLFALRRCYEHHGGVAAKAFTIHYKELLILHNDMQIMQLPHPFEAGAKIGPQIVTRQRVVLDGTKPSLTESETRHIAFTLQSILASEVVVALYAK
ncbi:MAG: hypothetical protein ACKV2U_19845 [Bryobacteraceae bacterium]